MEERERLFDPVGLPCCPPTLGGNMSSQGPNGLQPIRWRLSQSSHDHDHDHEITLLLYNSEKISTTPIGRTFYVSGTNCQLQQQQQHYLTKMFVVINIQKTYKYTY